MKIEIPINIGDKITVDGHDGKITGAHIYVGEGGVMNLRIHTDNKNLPNFITHIKNGLKIKRDAP
jgi:hypothetical protein